jgi:hypothetical protein
MKQLETIQYILEHAHIDETTLEQNRLLIQMRRDDIHKSLQLSRMQIMQGRPKLRDKLTTSQQQAKHKLTMQNSWETFTGFCYKHQFPPTLSDNVKHKLYFMASQTNWDWRAHIHHILPHGPQIVTKVCEFPVAQPDIPVILRVIEGISMEGRVPFNALNVFRTKCFTSFPTSQTENMSFTQFLQLYVAAYQPHHIWKDLWKHLVGVLSVQIIRDCEKFTSENPLDCENIIDLLCRSSISA